MDPIKSHTGLKCPQDLKTVRTVLKLAGRLMYTTQERYKSLFCESRLHAFLICVALCLCISDDIIVTDGPLIGF